MNVDPRYPIGNFEKPAAVGSDLREELIADIRELPLNLAKAVEGLDDAKLDTPYREGGWSVRQVVHHVADSHINALCRFKLALTEEHPVIKPYDEAAWAALEDSGMPVSASMPLIESVHKRFTRLLESMSDEDFARTLDHPESGSWRLDEMLALYGWHSKHHTAHITSLRERNGW